jgi:hypothetical protein
MRTSDRPQQKAARMISGLLSFHAHSLACSGRKEPSEEGSTASKPSDVQAIWIGFISAGNGGPSPGGGRAMGRMQDIAPWLANDAPHDSVRVLFAAFCGEMVQSGVPIWRASLGLEGSTRYGADGNTSGPMRACR